MSRMVKKSNSVAIRKACVATAMLALLMSGGASAAEKLIKNGSNVEVGVKVTAADGSPEKEGRRTDLFKAKAGGSTKITYGNDQNPYLHELLIYVDEPKAKATNIQHQWVNSTGRAPALDNTLNANSTLTIVALGKFDVTGGNGGSVKSGSKRIVNKSNVDLDVVLTPRKGNASKSVTIKKGETRVIQFGSDNAPYLDGLRVQWQDSTLKSGCRQERLVTGTGGAGTWDATLNTNDTLTINSVSALKVTGSN